MSQRGKTMKLDFERYSRLQRVANRQGVFANEAHRQAIDDYCDRVENPDRPQLLTIDQAAAELQVSKRTMYRCIEGGLPTVQIGVRSLIRIARTDLDTWLAERRTIATAQRARTIVSHDPRRAATTPNGRGVLKLLPEMGRQ